MIPVVISASVFKNNKYACLQRVKELIKTLPDYKRGLLLDEKFIKQNNDISTETESVSDINMSDWMDSTYQPIKIKIRSQADSLPANQIILLDARHHDAQVISTLLHEISQVWFHLKLWQPAFVLIVDDYHASRFARELAETFYIQSLSTSIQDIQAEVRKMRMRILFLRWLGFSRLSLLVRALYHFLQKLKRYVHKKIT